MSHRFIVRVAKLAKLCEGAAAAEGRAEHVMGVGGAAVGAIRAREDQPIVLRVVAEALAAANEAHLR